MASGSNEGIFGKHTLLMLVLIWGLEAAAVGAVVPDSWLVDSLEREREMVRSWMGDEAAQKVEGAATSWFNLAFRETGLVKGSIHAVTPTEAEKARSGDLAEMGNPFFTWLEGRIKVFWSAVFQSVQRLAVFWTWAPYLLIILVPAIADGFLRREIKKQSYGYSSPIRFQAAAHLIFFTILLFGIYLGLPMAIPPIVAPILGFGLSLVLMVQMANLQKRV